MLKLYLTVLYLVLVAVVAEDQCKKRTCTCEFADDSVGGESAKAQAAKKSEILAAAAGAMSPLLIGGAGLGIYKLVKSRGSGSMSLDRSGSDLSETSEGLPPKYSRRIGSSRSLISSKHKPDAGGGTNNWAF